MRLFFFVLALLATLSADAAVAGFSADLPAEPSRALTKAMGAQTRYASEDKLLVLDCSQADSCQVQVNVSRAMEANNDILETGTRLEVALAENEDAGRLYQGLDLPVLEVGALSSKYFGTPNGDMRLACRKRVGNDEAAVFSCSLQITLQ